MLYSIGSMMWATRFWWMLKSLGFDGAAVLDGGFDKWKAEGRPTESGAAKRLSADRRSRPSRARACSSARSAVQRRDRRAGTVTVNALGPAVPQGARAQPLRPARARPRQRQRAGGDPGRPATKGFTTLADAEAKLDAPGRDQGQATSICYCGGGISATIDLFLLHQLGYDKLTLYDGSMGEWAKDKSLPIETD